MAVVWMESGTDATQDFSMYSSIVNAVTSDATQQHTGPRSIKVAASGGGLNAQANRAGVLADAGRRISFWWRTAYQPAANAAFMYFVQSGGSLVSGLRLKSTGVLEIDCVGTGPARSGTTLINLNQWYHIAFSYVLVSTTVFSHRLYLDGKLEAEIINTGTMERIGTDTFRLNMPSGHPDGSHWFFDDIYIDDGTDLGDPGDIRVTNKRPNANGGTNTFDTTTGSGSGYGTGNSVYVNAIPLSPSNARSFAAAGGSVAENFAIEGLATGDVDITRRLLLARLSWVHGSGVSTDTIYDNGSNAVPESAVFGSTGLYWTVTDSTTYPSSTSAVGMGRPTGDATDAILNECGMLIAYLQNIVAVWMESGTDATGDLSFFSSFTGSASSAVDQQRTGPRSVLLDTGAGNNDAAVRAFDVLADAGRRVSMQIRHATLPVANTTIFFPSTTGGAAVFELDYRTNGQLSLYANGVGDTGAFGPSNIGQNVWARIAVAYVITSATVWKIVVFLDGVSVFTWQNAGTLTNTATNRAIFYIYNPAGANFKRWYDDIYIDDGTDLGDPGDVRVINASPATENTTAFDAAVGAARGASDWNNVDEVPLSETNGWQHRGVAFVAAGALATNATTTTLTITAPACSVDDILIAYIHGRNNQTVSPPDGTWTLVVEVNNTTAMRSSVFWKRATASGGTHAFTKPTDDNNLFAGLIVAYKGCIKTGNVIDATTPTSSVNASSDAITYATFNPTEVNGLVIAAGFKNNDITNGEAISGTDPTFTKNADVETDVGGDCSIFVYDGISSGAATGARSHLTGGTNAVNTGILFGLVAQAQENYTLQTASAAGIAGKLIMGTMAWMWAKVSATTGTPTAALIDDGAAISQTLTTAGALYTNVQTRTTYPSNAAGIGMRSSGSSTPTDSYLYECGMLIAFISPIKFFRSLLGVGM